VQSVKLLIKIGLAQLEHLFVEVAVSHRYSPIHCLHNSFFRIIFWIEALSFEFIADQPLHPFAKLDALPENVFKVADQE
jgi:steroid 5-alpha reductase family enzyme